MTQSLPLINGPHFRVMKGITIAIAAATTQLLSKFKQNKTNKIKKI